MEVDSEIDEICVAGLKASLAFNDGSVIITLSVAIESETMIKRVNL